MKEGLSKKQITQLTKDNLVADGFQEGNHENRFSKYIGVAMLVVTIGLIGTAGILVLSGNGHILGQITRGIQHSIDQNSFSGLLSQSFQGDIFNPSNKPPNFGHPNVPVITNGTKSVLCSLNDLFCPR